jgi:hypothetical protein
MVWRKRADKAPVKRREALLRARPELREAWEEEEHLTALLESLVCPDLSSNFTARVVAAAEEELRSKARRRGPWGLPWLRPSSLLPRLAVAGLAAGLCLISYQQYRELNRRAIAASLASVPAQTAVTDVDLLKDFEWIDSLSQAPAVDLELLAALD